MLRELLRARSTAALDSAGDHLLLRTDATGLDQLAEWHAGVGRPLTALDERVTTARYRPGHRQAVVEGDAGGNERSQLWLLDLDGPPARDRSLVQALTHDPGTVHLLAGMSPDGRRVAVLSNRRDRAAFDVWLLDLDTGDERLLHDGGGWCQPASGFSPDGRWLSVLRPGPRPMDTDLLLLDVATGEPRVVLPHLDEAAVVGAPAWVDATTLVVSSNVGRDRHALIRVDLTTDEATVVLARAWDVAGWTSPDGRTLLAVSNVDGSSAGELFDARTMAPRGRLRLPDPDAVMAWSHLLPDPLVADNGSVVATCSSPSMPPDVWRLRADAPPEPVTQGPLEVDRTRLRRPERHTVTSADGLAVPLLLYRPVTPAGAPPPPAVVMLHGGPEGQSQPVFSPVVQALAARGYAVALPNVRGSTGYGKRYYGLDDTTRRLDSLRDLAAVHGWLTHAGLDPGRVALWGTSYGGYLVLAGCAFQPELWAAGVDVAGISDLITFLERTADHRRAHREREYGSLSTDREFLAAASPLRRAGQIRAPLFVVHGANDPRVPLNEAQQLVAALRSRDVPCELLVYGDEGHGLAKLANRLDAHPRAVAFLDRVLGRPWIVGTDDAMDSTATTPVPSGHTPEGGVLVGSDNARRRLVVFEDPQCPYCRQFEEASGDLLRREVAAGAVAIEYRMRCFLGPESVRADNALALAAETGRFDQLRRELFASQPPEHSGGFTTEDLIALGRRVDLDDPPYVTGVREGRYDAWVLEVDRAFQEQDPQGTPAALLDGEPVDSSVLYDDQALGDLLRA